MYCTVKYLERVQGGYILQVPDCVQYSTWMGCIAATYCRYQVVYCTVKYLERGEGSYILQVPDCVLH